MCTWKSKHAQWNTWRVTDPQVVKELSIKHEISQASMLCTVINEKYAQWHAWNVRDSRGCKKTVNESVKMNTEFSPVL